MALSQTEGDFLVLHEFIQAAHKKLDRNIWDYLVGATATETTLMQKRTRLSRTFAQRLPAHAVAAGFLLTWRAAAEEASQ
jgi:hypothetical protein